MNWETYKGLPPELKSEYMFRFGKKPKLGGPGYLISLSVWLLAMGFLLMVSFMYVKDPELIKYGIEVSQIVQQGVAVSKLSFWILGVYLIIDYGSILFYYTKRYWWLKKHHIKKVKGTIWRITDDSTQP